MINCQGLGSGGGGGGTMDELVIYHKNENRSYILRIVFWGDILCSAGNQLVLAASKPFQKRFWAAAYPSPQTPLHKKKL